MTVVLVVVAVLGVHMPAHSYSPPANTRSSAQPHCNNKRITIAPTSCSGRQADTIHKLINQIILTRMTHTFATSNLVGRWRFSDRGVEHDDASAVVAMVDRRRFWLRNDDLLDLI